MRQSSTTFRRQALLDLLREIREQAGLRQTDVASSIGKPQSFVSKYESGERRVDLLELEQICDACDVNLSGFVERYMAKR